MTNEPNYVMQFRDFIIDVIKGNTPGTNVLRMKAHELLTYQVVELFHYPLESIKRVVNEGSTLDALELLEETFPSDYISFIQAFNYSGEASDFLRDNRESIDEIIDILRFEGKKLIAKGINDYNAIAEDARKRLIEAGVINIKDYDPKYLDPHKYIEFDYEDEADEEDVADD